MRPEPTTAIVRRGEDEWGGAAAGPANGTKLRDDIRDRGIVESLIETV